MKGHLFHTVALAAQECHACDLGQHTQATACNQPAVNPKPEHVIAGKPVDDGVLLVCSCGTETHVVTVQANADGNLIPTPMEQAFTCEGCGTSHWFRIGGSADDRR